jgi:thioredoxin 1
MSLSVNEHTFNQVVLNSPSPVLVHFWAPWCGLCRLIVPLLNCFQTEWAGQVQVVDINADDNLKLANQYRLSTLPTLLFIDRGEVVERFEGFRGRDDLRLALDALMRSHQPVSQYGELSLIPAFTEAIVSDQAVS